jgi:hypothetical protein
MKLRHTIPAVALLLAPFAMPVSAHHSYAMFDMQNTISLSGSIVQFKWQNPHAWIEIDADVGGKRERWAIEMTSPNNLILQGFKRTSMKPGDKVVMQVHPLRSGSKGGSFGAVRLSDGTVLGTWEG